MPIYEYICSSCGIKFEKLVRSGDPVGCESCGSSEVEKQFSVFAVMDGGKAQKPECSTGCGTGFQAGRCGSGMCCGANR